jgi:hypothetical protein
MQRSKQQALMFLLGAVLVGGVLGFSADRVMSKRPHRVSGRVIMYDEIGITGPQRATMDSILDDTNCKIFLIGQPLKPAMDSARNAGRQAIRAVMNPTQQAAFDAREARMKAYVDSVDKVRAARGETGDRCGNPSRPGSPGQGGHRGPGGPFF